MNGRAFYFPLSTISLKCGASMGEVESYVKSNKMIDYADALFNGSRISVHWNCSFISETRRKKGAQKRPKKRFYN